MYTLLLLRHAQSAEKQPGQPDRDRELTQHGMTQCMQLGNYLTAENFDLDLILTSNAVRALATAQIVSEALKNNITVLEEPELFDASPRTFLQTLSQIDSKHSCVLVVGHNPTISYAAEYLTKSEIGELPPCGMVVIQFDFSGWIEIHTKQGELRKTFTEIN